MANTIFKLNPQNKVLYAVGLFCLMLLVQKGAATQFTVGGSKGWSVPSPNDVHFNQWAENSRFQIGDSLRKLLSFPSCLHFNINYCLFNVPFSQYRNIFTIFVYTYTRKFWPMRLLIRLDSRIHDQSWIFFGYQNKWNLSIELISKWYIILNYLN